MASAFVLAMSCVSVMNGLKGGLCCQHIAVNFFLLIVLSITVLRLLVGNQLFSGTTSAVIAEMSKQIQSKVGLRRIHGMRQTYMSNQFRYYQETILCSVRSHCHRILLI